MKRFEERLEASEKSLRVAPKKVEKISSLRFTVFSNEFFNGIMGYSYFDETEPKIWTAFQYFVI